MAELTQSPGGIPYRVSGQGTPPFIFVGQLEASASPWAAQVANLSRDRLCVEVQARNADDVEEVLGVLRPGPALIAAAHEDAMTALLFCELYPEAVNGIVLVDPPLPPADEQEHARTESLVKLADKKPFMVIWPEAPAGSPGWLRDIAMFVRQEPVAGAPSEPRTEQPDITNALFRAFLDDVKNDPRLP